MVHQSSLIFWVCVLRTELGLAEWTGLEPATLGVTGRYSNQLNYHSIPSSVVTEKQNYTELLSPVKVYN